MSAFLASGPVQGTLFQPGGNTPAAGALLFAYQVGTSTKQATFTDASASTARTNPIVLDSGGNVPGNGEVWIASSAKFVLAPSSDTDPPSSPYWSMDHLPGINNVSSNAASEWVTGSTATFVGVTAFSVAGDQTTLYTLGRRIKATVTGGDRFGIVTSSVFGGVNTVVGVTLDSSTLNAGLSVVSYGLLSTPNGSVPWAVETTSGINFIAQITTNTLTVVGSTSAYGPVNFFSVAYNNAQTQVTSSVNPNIWNGGNVINFTGTTTVTSFANAPQAGASRSLIVASTVTFTSTGSLGIGGGLSTYDASPGEKLDVYATSTNLFTLYPGFIPTYGTWGASLTFGASSTGWIFSGSGLEPHAYVKIGKFVFASFDLSVSFKGSAAGVCALVNLPFTSHATGIGSAAQGGGSLADWQIMLTNFVIITTKVDNGTTTAKLMGSSSATASLTQLTDAAFQVGSRISGMLCYRSAA
jgi:hypothetical protein